VKQLTQMQRYSGTAVISQRTASWLATCLTQRIVDTIGKIEAITSPLLK